MAADDASEQDTPPCLAGCGRTASPGRKGYCHRDYMRIRRGGTAALTGPKPKPCRGCGATFQPKYNRQVYCAADCRLGIATCENPSCAKTFTIKEGTAGRFCSTTCWYTRPTESKRCPVCGKVFTGSAATCSPDCGYAHVRASNPRRQAECEWCGASMTLKKPGTRFCSRSHAMYANSTRGQRGIPQPEGARREHGSGYTLIKVAGKWLMEHRWVYEQHHGVTLEPHQRIHHKNGNRADNRPENLELWKVKTKKDPAGVRAADYHCPGCCCGDET